MIDWEHILFVPMTPPYLCSHYIWETHRVDSVIHLHRLRYSKMGSHQELRWSHKCDYSQYAGVSYDTCNGRGTKIPLLRRAQDDSQWHGANVRASYQRGGENWASSIIPGSSITSRNSTREPNGSSVAMPNWRANLMMFGGTYHNTNSS